MLIKNEIVNDSFHFDLINFVYGFDVDIWTRRENFKVRITADYDVNNHHDYFYNMFFARSIALFLRAIEDKVFKFGKHSLSSKTYEIVKEHLGDYYNETALKNITLDLNNDKYDRLISDLKSLHNKREKVKVIRNLDINVNTVNFEIFKMDGGNFNALRNVKIKYQDLNIILSELEPSSVVLTKEMSEKIINSAINQVERHTTTRKRVCF